jgi:hypothetical protein
MRNLVGRLNPVTFVSSHVNPSWTEAIARPHPTAIPSAAPRRQLAAPDAHRQKAVSNTSPQVHIWI